MSKLRRVLALTLALILCMSMLTACGSGKKKKSGFRVLGELNQEEFHVAFRADDPLCDIVTAAMQELAAEGQLSRLCSQYLGVDHSCLEGKEFALTELRATMDIPEGRFLRIGVQDGVAPLSSSRDDGSFAGLIPDLAKLVAEKLGWSFEYMVINSENVAAELGSGNIDFAWMAASLSGNSGKYSLSPGWLKNTHELVVRNGSNISSKKSLKGKILGVTDSTSVDALKEDELSDKIGAVWYYDSLTDCFNALASGDCDALVIDSIVSRYYL